MEILIITGVIILLTKFLLYSITFDIFNKIFETNKNYWILGLLRLFLGIVVVVFILVRMGKFFPDNFITYNLGILLSRICIWGGLVHFFYKNQSLKKKLKAFSLAMIINYGMEFGFHFLGFSSMDLYDFRNINRY